MRHTALIIVLLLTVVAGAAIVGRSFRQDPAVERVAHPKGLHDSGRSAASAVAVSVERRHAPHRAATRGPVRIREVSPGRYEVSRADVQALLDNAGALLPDLSLRVIPLPSFERGIQYWISSAAGDGVLTDRGFTVTDPKLAEAAGIQPGDTIRRINGYPVHGFYVTVLSMRRDPDRSTVQVELDRRGQRVIQTYRIL